MNQGGGLGGGIARMTAASTTSEPKPGMTAAGPKRPTETCGSSERTTLRHPAR